MRPNGVLAAGPRRCVGSSGVPACRRRLARTPSCVSRASVPDAHEDADVASCSGTGLEAQPQPQQHQQQLGRRQLLRGATAAAAWVPSAALLGGLAAGPAQATKTVRKGWPECLSQLCGPAHGGL